MMMMMMMMMMTPPPLLLLLLLPPHLGTLERQCIYYNAVTCCWVVALRRTYHPDVPGKSGQVFVATLGDDG